MLRLKKEYIGKTVSSKADRGQINTLDIDEVDYEFYYKHGGLKHIFEVVDEDKADIKKQEEEPQKKKNPELKEPSVKLTFMQRIRKMIVDALNNIGK